MNKFFIFFCMPFLVFWHYDVALAAYVKRLEQALQEVKKG